MADVNDMMGVPIANIADVMEVPIEDIGDIGGVIPNLEFTILEEFQYGRTRPQADPTVVLVFGFIVIMLLRSSPLITIIGFRFP